MMQRLFSRHRVNDVIYIPFKPASDWNSENFVSVIAQTFFWESSAVKSGQWTIEEEAFPNFVAKRIPDTHDFTNYAINEFQIFQWFTQGRRTPISQDEFEESRAAFRGLYETGIKRVQQNHKILTFNNKLWVIGGKFDRKQLVKMMLVYEVPLYVTSFFDSCVITPIKSLACPICPVFFSGFPKEWHGQQGFDYQKAKRDFLIRRIYQFTDQSDFAKSQARANNGELLTKHMNDAHPKDPRWDLFYYDISHFTFPKMQNSAPLLNLSGQQIQQIKFKDL